jgi:sugar lactone lactonase YvrE
MMRTARHQPEFVAGKRRRRRVGVRACGALLAMSAMFAAVTPAAAEVYWSEQGAFSHATGSIARADNGGRHVKRRFIVGLRLPCGVAVDQGHIYWGTQFGHAIGRADLDGRHVRRRLVTTSILNPCLIAVGGGHIFWAESTDSSEFVAPDLVARANLDGSNVVRSFIDTMGAAVTGLAVSGSWLYWVQEHDFAGAVYRADIATGQVDESFAIGGEGGDTPAGVAADAQNLFWTTVGGQIKRSDLDGRQPRVIATANFQIAAITAGGPFVFVETQNDPAAIFRVGKDGSHPTHALIGRIHDGNVPGPIAANGH